MRTRGRSDFKPAISSAPSRSPEGSPHTSISVGSQCPVMADIEGSNRALHFADPRKTKEKEADPVGRLPNLLPLDYHRAAGLDRDAGKTGFGDVRDGLYAHDGKIGFPVLCRLQSLDQNATALFLRASNGLRKRTSAPYHRVGSLRGFDSQYKPCAHDSGLANVKGAKGAKGLHAKRNIPHVLGIRFDPFEMTF